MLKLLRPLQRRGWATARMLILSAYLMRGGEHLSAWGAHHFGIHQLPAVGSWPWYIFTPLALPVFALADAILRGLHSLGLGSLLRRPDLPTFLHPLEMVWPRSIREQVWRPSYYDAEALYREQPRGSSRRLQNFLFLKEVALMVPQTLYVMFVLRPLSHLGTWRFW